MAGIKGELQDIVSAPDKKSGFSICRSLTCGECSRWQLCDYEDAKPEDGVLFEVLLGKCSNKEDNALINYDSKMPVDCCAFTDRPESIDWYKEKRRIVDEKIMTKIRSRMSPTADEDPKNKFDPVKINLDGEVDLGTYFSKSYFLSRASKTESLFLYDNWVNDKGQKFPQFAYDTKKHGDSSLCNQCVSLEIQPDNRCVECEIHKDRLNLCLRCKDKSTIMCMMCFHSR